MQPLLQRTRDVGGNANAAQCYCALLHCAIVQSGSNVRGRAAISKRGSAQLRRALYFPALVALQHNPIIKVFGERLKGNGKRGKVLVCAAMRKLMHLIFGVLKHHQPFNPQAGLEGR